MIATVCRENQISFPLKKHLNGSIEKKELREQMAGRVEVLDKVKELFLMPKLDMLTTQQVAEYYEVEYDVIRVCYQRNRAEIETDGAPIASLKFLKAQFVPIKIEHGKCAFQIADDTTLEVPNRGVRMFSKRAILRIGMLLRDSKIAQEVMEVIFISLMFGRTFYPVQRNRNLQLILQACYPAPWSRFTADCNRL